MKDILQPLGPSPTDIALRSGPRGNGLWPGFSTVYSRISRGAEYLGRTAHLSDDHIDTMADLGSGHEERMKARVLWLLQKGIPIL
jgi:hypothetical protein